ncbi:Retrovirus-related Pol polyprotein from transposon RE1 [Vitis vinifera]|uniref:Retrovirus-related Pol polyprotein from transposon RE1 n=1 Tax=Vitis vinifera TaxID=29760 RepID=A0A438E752_VITVI|nr:Retrovirus-related Pol polyprotein from transposon RE1 [Vitis vinifera]
MSSTASQSSSSSGSAQSSSMASIPSYQMLNYSLPVKLNRTNYILWRSQIDNVIFANGFEDFIDGTSVCPEKELRPGEINPAFVAWRRQDRTILSWIYSSLTPGIMAQIIGHNSSHSAWNALKKIFSSCSRARIMQLRLEFQSTKKGSMSMIDYIMKVKGAADSLAAIGEPVSEQDQIMNLLGGLGSDYNAVVTAINIREDKISLEAVHSMLLAFEQRLEQQGSIEQLPAMSANYASSSNNRGDIDRVVDKTPARLKDLNASYVESLATQFRSVITDLTSPFRALRTILLVFQILVIQILCLLWLLPLTILQMIIGTLTLEQVIISLKRGKFNQCYTLPGADKVTIGNGKHLTISNTGFTRLFSNPHSFQLKKVFHVPFISANLISVAKFCSDNNALIEFHSNGFFVKDLHTKRVLAQGKLENGLYKFPVISNRKTAYVGITNDSTFQCSTIENKMELWHHRLGHAATDIVTRIMHNCNVSCGKYKATVCSSCQLAKSHRLPTHLSSFHASKLLNLFTLTYGDLPLSRLLLVQSILFCFVDDYSRYTWLYLLQSKDQALPIFKQFKLQVENQFDAKIKCLQSDNGGEFRSFMSFLQESGTFLINRMPSKVLQNDSPYFALFKRNPDYKFLRVFGCLCYPFIRPYNNHKLQYRSLKCVFLATVCITKDASDESVIPTIIVSSNPSTLSFHGSNHSMASPNLTSALTHPTPPTDTPTTRSLREPVLEAEVTLPAQQQVVVPPPRVTTRSMSGITKRKHIFNLAAFKISEPTTLKQAIKDPNWAEAMQTEIAALHKNQTWDLVDRPKDVNIIGCKWVYKLKYKPDGSVDRYKARLVARGFNQTFGLDYFETFSPVVKAATIRIVLTIALSYRWELRQLDVQNAFLNGDLVEQVYMAQPPGFLHPNHPNKVCKLKKALYGLKQSPRAWFTKLSSALLSWGFNSSRTDSSMFVHFGTHSTLIVLVYVDDIIVTGRIEVTYDGGSMHLSQSKYITDLLQRTSMLNSKAAATPGTVGLSLSQFDGDLMDDVTMYRSVVGALQYATLTRPDIAFSVNKACQFMHRPTSTHWYSVKRILRYLKGTTTHGLLLQPSAHFTVQAYTDADWGAQPDDRRSSSGYLVYLGNNLVSWTASKQKVVSRSSAESEYRGLAIATVEIIWTQALLSELCISITSIPTLYYDNISAYYMAKNPVFHARTKHIEIDLHFIRDQVLHNKLQLQYIPSTDQPADILTKHLTSSRFLSLRSHLCLVPRPFSLRGDDKPDVRALDAKMKAGHMCVVPRFFVASAIADGEGMECFSITTSTQAVFGELTGKTSVLEHYPHKLYKLLSMWLQSLSNFSCQRPKTAPFLFLQRTRLHINGSLGAIIICFQDLEGLK